MAWIPAFAGMTGPFSGPNVAHYIWLNAYDKKIDPRKLRFGSRVDNFGSGDQQYYTVKEILSPTVLVLDSGLKIRLLGVKERASGNGDV